ncbi:NAD(P)/FAD-dependent oxidoreductase [Paenibacillus sp. NPDC058174]|uniref:NAD(P)/FAD-dependent oxidoreductase n=1 Tax=Paenibacillus sp. NPDC058174 TaxID=3346366 RepID=UPI0036DDEA1F
MTDNAMVIIGAGETGARAAAELRERGWTGAITLIGEESHAPYERPPLSKQVLQEAGEPSPAYIVTTEKLQEQRIDFIHSSKAASIDRSRHIVSMEDGRQFRYERLLLATGARPRMLQLSDSGSGAGSAPNIRYLRSYADALALRSQLQPGQRVAIIGGGFIGLEVAASARHQGCAVTVIEAGPRILMRGVPEAIARVVEARHRGEGVSFKLNASIQAIDSSDSESIMTFTGGEALAFDVILAGIGAVPDTVLASGCGLTIENGIAVDERLNTSDPDIFAAGDCCSFPHPLYGGMRIRLEAWRNAQEQGTHAAGSMLGSNEAYAAVPWFWSDQYDLTLQVTGLPHTARTTVHRSLGATGDLYFHLTDDYRLAAASAIGRNGIAKDIRLAEMLIASRAALDPVQLAAPDIKLRSLLTV